jgi:hypothetical protein
MKPQAMHTSGQSGFLEVIFFPFEKYLRTGRPGPVAEAAGDDQDSVPHVSLISAPEKKQEGEKQDLCTSVQHI